MNLCGYCAGAAMNAKPNESHMRCPGGRCACAALLHQPDDNVRRSQSGFCHMPLDRVVERDPGFDAEDIKLLKLKEAHGMTTDQTLAVSEAEQAAIAEAEKMSLPKLRAALSKAKVPGGAQMGKLEAATAYVNAVAEGKIAEAKAERDEKLEKIQQEKETKMATKATKGTSTSKVNIPLSKLGFKEGETVVIDKSNRFKLARGAKVKVLSAFDTGRHVRVVVDGGKDVKGSILADRVVSASKFDPDKATTKRGDNLKRKDGNKPSRKPAKKQPAKKAAPKTAAPRGAAKKMAAAKKVAAAKKAPAKKVTAEKVAVPKSRSRKTVTKRTAKKRAA